MPAVTLAELRTRVLQAADLEGSSFVTTAELNVMVNGSVDALYDLLVGVWEDYFAKDIAVTLTGTSFVLPVDFYKLGGLDGVGSDSRWFPVQEAPWAERNRWRNLQGARPEDVRYTLRGNTLQFLPGFGTQSVTGSLSYIPLRPRLVGDTDSVDFPQQWEEWAVIHAGLKCLTKAERDLTGLDYRMKMEDARIAKIAPKRRHGEVERVADVDYPEEMRTTLPRVP